MTRRDEALDAALRLFAEQGYAATTIAQVEAAIGLSPGSGGLFRHVSSKQELLQLAVERAMTRRHDPPPGPFASPAHALALSVLRVVDADPHLWRLMLRDGTTLPLDFDAVYARLIQPAFDQAVEWARTRIGDAPDVRERVIVGISALLYLRVSTLVYGRTPADIDEDSFIAVATQLFGGQMP
jgi:AcrR family transcriptional regulator